LFTSFALSWWLGRAQDAVSVAEGAISFQVPSGQTRSISIPLNMSPAGGGQVVGRLTAVGVNYLENVNAGWISGFFSAVDSPFFVRITSGSAVGRIFKIATTPNTSNRIYIYDDGVGLATLGIQTGANGDTFEVFPGDTLLSLFKANLLQGGASSAEADNVLVWGGASYLVFYYNTVRNRWERDSDTAVSPSRDTYALRPDRGVMVTRRGAGDLTLVFAGRVPSQNIQLFHLRPGTTFIATGFPVDMSLSSLELNDPSRASNWQGAPNPSVAASLADLVQVWGGASWLTFYYDTTNRRWQREGDAAGTNRDGFVIPAGRPIFLRRISGGTSAAELTITLPLPYTI